MRAAPSSLGRHKQNSLHAPIGPGSSGWAAAALLLPAQDAGQSCQMASGTNLHNLKAVADEVLASLANHRQTRTFSSRPGGLTLNQAYYVTSLLRTAFEARGEQITGRKVGFTNRDVWG